ncbi:MAG TPA: methyltransferase [Desulfurivibrionaceae bacterium]|nr:methyltransferase [Desulfurivibrionaceae bacterium]
MPPTNQEHPPRSKPADILLRIAAFFIILEPLWMLLPFAGFLYGSVMHIQTLSQNPYTAPLVYFVFPTHTLFPLGLLLILAGFLLFLIGAFQIYYGKLRRRGLIRTGIYRRFRHPQYLALTIFGIGIILTWGRLITFIAFFVMLWLYYFLARREERKCRELFGQEYDQYCDETCFLLPGAERFLASAGRLYPAGIPAAGRVLLSFLLVIGLASGGGLLIIKIRAATRQSIPVITGSYALPDRMPDRVPLLMVKGPALQAAPVDKIRDEFMARGYEMLLASPRLTRALEKLELTEGSTLLAFLTPGPNWYEDHLDFQQAEVDVIIFCLETPVDYKGDNFREFRRNWRITQLVRAEEMSYGRLTNGLDPVAGKVAIEPSKERMTERVDFLLSGLK